ncbi:MAG TPA: hypothetical protein PKK06_05620 [Phycisphaerae bacterium]|nr:hypothetical protein [Phycisphaerae bacterium]HNU44763.1 hypothetical protein [Phycisphaerae bacterium]
MNNEMIEDIDRDELPVNGSIQVLRNTGYGTIAELDDEEPADVHELQCLAAWQMYAPLLALPGRYGQTGRVVLDADGEIDWDRIGPAGGRRRRPQQSRTGRDDVRRVLGLISLLLERIPGTAKYAVLRYLRMGILRPEHVSSADLRAVAQLEARARSLQQTLEA